MAHLREVEMKIVQARFLCGVLVVLSSLLLFACGDGGSSSTTAGGVAPGAADSAVNASNTGSVSVSLTDNDQGYNAVVLTIVEVGIVASHNETTYYNSTELDNLPITVNVLDFPEDATLHLADIEVDLPENGDPVCFNQIRMILAENPEQYKKGGECDDNVPCNNYVVENDDLTTAYALKTPSAQQSGVKILTPNDFCIEEGDDTVDISIDFDPMTAIVHTGNEKNDKHKYILKPTGIRIIEGDWYNGPDSYIDGLVAVPTYNTAEVCEEYPTTPMVTVAAYNGASLEAQTVALADDGPAANPAACEEWCEDDFFDGPTYNSCRLDCEEELCFYSGGFKLLVDKGIYELEATWEDFSDELIGVEYNSTVLMVLDRD
jgi:hypothetical protein